MPSTDYILKAVDGRVNYVMKTYLDPYFGSALQVSVEWMLHEYKPHRSTEFEGYPICVKVDCGTEYFFEGEWPEKPKRKKKVLREGGRFA